MWIKYSDSEVNKYHPICEKVLNRALTLLNLKNKYEVIHHQCVGSLEMDFAIRNKKTGLYLCVIEVKRTLADVQSARNQFQAMSYVQMASSELEKPFYILTNLENSYIFRYDSNRPKVFQQILNPGLIHFKNFEQCSEEEFIEQLSQVYKELINSFINNNYKYLLTLEHFSEYMNKMKKDPKSWKSSLVILLYEYIRGAFIAIGRNELRDVRTFSNNVKMICEEAIKVNFDGIFKYNENEFLPKIKIDNNLLSNLYDLGHKNISADSIADVLHSLVCENKESTGLVATDTELARIVALLAKYVYGNNNVVGKVCDPAAGSGSLICSAVNILGLEPKDIIVNEIEPNLIQLLSLRMGLKFPNTVRRSNCPIIKNKDIVDLTLEEFNDIDIVLLNPPYVAGIKCSKEKIEISNKISSITHRKAVTNIGQIGLEGVFIELVNSLVKKGTVISCILPKQYLVARGEEAIAFRKFLINDFGLQVIFNYPGNDLFNMVTKDTVILVGKKGYNNKIKIISSLESVQDIDAERFESALKGESIKSEDFNSIMPGIEAKEVSRSIMIDSIYDGWRDLNSELSKSIEFVNNELIGCEKLVSINSLKYKFFRGKAANNGANDLLYTKNSIYTENLHINYSENLYTGMKNATIDELILENGDSYFVNYKDIIHNEDINHIINSYVNDNEKCSSAKQLKKTKSNEEIKKILIKESKNYVDKNCVLIPRNLRVKGKVYITTGKTYVSTNFFILNTENIREAKIISSWISTIFYQLMCEVSSKDQEGTRKMEKMDIIKTLVPNPKNISEKEYFEIEEIFKDIEFLNLQEPKIREIDRCWAKILYSDKSEDKLNEAVQLLSFIANKRNSKRIK